MAAPLQPQPWKEGAERAFCEHNREGTHVAFANFRETCTACQTVYLVSGCEARPGPPPDPLPPDARTGGNFGRVDFECVECGAAVDVGVPKGAIRETLRVWTWGKRR